MSLPAIKRRYEKKSYRNFNLAIYCPVQNISQIDDFDAFNEKFDAAFGDMKIGRVYLEDFRAEGHRYCRRNHDLCCQQSGVRFCFSVLLFRGGTGNASTGSKNECRSI